MKTPPYFTVKAPVFSFEKLTDANSVLGPEMKSTGEVLGVGRTLGEALYKGLTAAGMRVSLPRGGTGVIVSVDESEHHELASVVKKLYDRGLTIYATAGTARAIEKLGLKVTTIGALSESMDAFDLIAKGKVGFVVYTDAMYDSTVNEYNRLHQHALNHQVACFTSLDTANAMADVVAARYNNLNTELVDICNMRKKTSTLRFTKMQDSASDYIVIDNREDIVTCPEALCVTLCTRKTGVGADGMALIEKSGCADVKMRFFNSDGSEGKIAGNCMRYIAKYLVDKGDVKGRHVSVEACGKVYALEAFTVSGKVGAQTVFEGTVEY